GGVEVVPERLHGRRGRGRRRRGRVEARVVPQREHALLGGGREVGLEPGLLRRAGGCRDEARVAVQHDDVPGAQVVAVVSLGRVSRGGAEVAEVPGRRGARVVVVIADHGVGARLVAAPARIVTVLIGGGRPVGIGGVAQGEDGARNAVEQARRRFVVGAIAARDVARTHQRHRGYRLRDRDRGRGGAHRPVLVRHAHLYHGRPRG